jgi:putative Holliday junction resolvase
VPDPPEPPRPGRVLGLDLGQARIGVAVSDDGRRVAVPVGTVRTGAPQDVRAIAALVLEHGATEIVLGLPLSLSGREGEAADHARRFAQALEGFLGRPVHLQDERLSTVEAERGLRHGGVKGRDQREVIDQAAATVILQAWLDAHRDA